MDDLISRKAAIDWASKIPIHDLSDGRGFCRVIFADDFLKALKTIPLAQSRWIPCSERLPEEEDIYLVTFDKSNLLDNETQVTNAFWINNQWQYDVLESYEHRMPKLVVEPIEELKVIAWMPLPEPWKEKPNEIH